MNTQHAGEGCANCGDKIGSMETPRIYHRQVVCGVCNDKPPGVYETNAGRDAPQAKKIKHRLST